MNQLQIVLLLVSSNVLIALAQWDQQGPGQQNFGQGQNPFGGPGQPPFGGPGQSPFGPGSSPFGPGQMPFGPGSSPFGPGPQGPMFPGQNPGFGPPFGGQGFNPLYGGQGFPQQPFQAPQVLTCIGLNEALDHVKITLRPEPNSNFMGQNPAFQFGSPRELQRQDWRISAVYIPAGSLGAISPAGTSSLVGQFFLAITRYGRTDGSCAGLGGILQNDDLINPSQQPRASQFGNGMFGQSTPAGFIQDPIVISQGGNVYSGVVRNLAEVDLRGRGVAICLDYLCQRPTTTCCTVAKDTTPATENVGVSPNIGPLSGSFIKGGGSSSALASSQAGAGASGLANNGGSNSLFGNSMF